MKLVFQEVETLANSHGMFEYYIFVIYVSRISKLVLFVPINEQISTSISKIKDLFNNVDLLTLFKCYGNTCEWKSVVEIHVMLFKQRKLLFKQRYQTDPKFSSFDIFSICSCQDIPLNHKNPIGFLIRCQLLLMRVGFKEGISSNKRVLNKEVNFVPYRQANQYI